MGCAGFCTDEYISQNCRKQRKPKQKIIPDIHNEPGGSLTTEVTSLRRRRINRGFLIGPYLPIYGAGVAIVTMLSNLLAGYEDSYGLTFVISFFSCGTLEYFVSYYLEKRFHARWWDYSRKPMNLHGRVWIGNLILFGIAGTVIGKIIDPIFFDFISRFPVNMKYTLSFIIILVMGTDYTVSHFVMKLLKTGVENSEADDTEALNKEMKMLLSNRSVLHKRMAEAYPEVVYRTDKIRNRINTMKEESEALSREIHAQLAENKEAFLTSHEPAFLIREEIIAKQTTLIKLLESASSDQEQMDRLRNEIAVLKGRLKDRQETLDKFSPLRQLKEGKER